MKNLLQTLINYCKLALYLALLVSGIAPGFVNAQNSFTIMGKVVSATDAQPIPGVTILLKDTAVGTVTDMNGDYSLQVSQEGVLVFSFIGYQSREESINGRSIINVSLEDGAQPLDVDQYLELYQGD